MSKFHDSPERDEHREKSAVIIRLVNPSFGPGELVVLQRDHNGIEKEIDQVQIPEHLDNLIRTIRQIIETGRHQFILDFNSASSFNSAGLGWLLSIISVIRKAGASPVLTVTSERASQILRITKCDSAIYVCDSLESATKYLDDSAADAHTVRSRPQHDE